MDEERMKNERRTNKERTKNKRRANEEQTNEEQTNVIMCRKNSRLKRDAEDNNEARRINNTTCCESVFQWKLFNSWSTHRDGKSTEVHSSSPVRAAPEQNISASVGENVSLSFAPGGCSLTSAWAIVKMKPEGGFNEVSICRSNFSQPGRFKAQCPIKGQNAILEILLVELSDSGKYCLEQKEKLYSCVHLAVQNISSEAKSDQTNYTASGEWGSVLSNLTLSNDSADICDSYES
ncbi:hypothetical protein WMY93_012841 [Mugilogobius chulae]|uniref:Uncharacterized protein n=1 Tax=Mugilogobius chulae TaxID=88201 RepID=A0AAW0P7G3_9GOBI